MLPCTMTKPLHRGVRADNPLSICTPSGAMPFCSARLNFPDAAKSKEAQGAPPANCALHAPGGTHASLAPQGNQLMP